MKQVIKIAIYLLMNVALNSYSQEVLLGKFNCNGDVNGNGNLKSTNYFESEMYISDLILHGSSASLSYTDNSVELTLSSSVGVNNSLYFSVNSKVGYIVEIRKVEMKIKKASKAGNVVFYLNTLGLPSNAAESLILYDAGNGNTGTSYELVSISYPDNFDTPIIVKETHPAHFILSSGKNGGALSIDNISVYGYVHKEADLPSYTGMDRSFSVNLDKVTREVNPLFWGTNFLFWIEDDASLADGKIEQSLKNMPCTILRYPGGTVADNFHWKTNLLENKNRFPYEDGATKTDFDEFIAFCNRVNAEPILVVNTESWQIKQDIEGGVQEAVEWVQYCKDKGYKVKYWEIGNETYWQPFFTAIEYGQVVKQYAQAMKAIDPNIKISANGHWDIQMVGTKERTDSDQWENIRQMYQNITSKEEAHAAEKYADSYKNQNIRAGNEKWWSNVADECGEYIDMISVHWYFSGNNDMVSMTNNLNEIKQLFKTKYPDKEYALCLTEYNCNNENHKLAISGLFEGIGRFLEAGVEIANFWPLRNSIDGHRRSIMHLTTKEEGYAYRILQLMGSNLKGNMVEVETEDGIFPLVTYDENQLTVFVSGRAITALPAYVSMTLPQMEQFTLLDAKTYDAPESNQAPIKLEENDLSISISENGCSFQLMPYQTTILRFKKDMQSSVVNDYSNVKVSSQNNQLNIIAPRPVNVYVYNLQGVCVKQKSNVQQVKFSMDQNGLYLVKVHFLDGGQKTEKIFIKT